MSPKGEPSIEILKIWKENRDELMSLMEHPMKWVISKLENARENGDWSDIDILIDILRFLSDSEPHH
ncbi:hypothetical protein ACFLV4_07350 [Chloroflexota bacterium]